MKTIFATRSSYVFAAAIAAAAIIFMSVPFMARAEVLTRQLHIGMSGSDVTALQTFLAADPTLYPQGLVTGYYGSLTAAAVSRFQTRNGISAVGRVGPQTLPVLNAQMANGTVVSTGGAILSNTNVSIGTNNATVSFNTNEAVRASVFYSASPLNVSETPNDVVVSGASVASTDSTMTTSKAIAISGLQANTTYYYMVYTTDASGNVTVSSPTFFHTNQ